MDNLTIVIPFYNGHRHLTRLLNSLPAGLPVIVVDDVSAEPYKNDLPHVRVIRLREKGYFAGAVNAGIEACTTDVLVLNQDTELTGTAWLDMLEETRGHYAMVGERIAGEHPAWPQGYVHGTFMFMRRDALEQVGLLNGRDYPLWGNTCEWQLRAVRAGFHVLALEQVPGFTHFRQGVTGEGITQLLRDTPEKKSLFIRTPPEISVVVSCYNYGRYLPDLVNSLVGGPTCLGTWPSQTFASFEVVIVDDASTDDSWDFCQRVSDPWKGVRAIRRERNGGTAAANNTGIQAAHGKIIAIMNADDMMEPDRLERLYRVQMANMHSFVYDQVMAFADGARKPEKLFRVSPYDFEKLLYQNHVHAGIMFPKRAWREVGGYPELFGDGREDWAMNIALGIWGWCGVMVKEPGYLYRRERQNRTLTNTSPDHHQKFLNRLIRTFSRIYAGERPSMCCGNGPGNAQANVGISQQAARLAVPGGAGTVLLEYLGGSYGTISYYGPVTGARYEAGKTRPYINVDVRDVETGRANRPGLLEMREEGKVVFRKYVVPPSPPAPLPDAAQELESLVLEGDNTMPAFLGETPVVETGEGVSLSLVDQALQSAIPDVNALTAKEVLTLDGYASEVWAAMLETEKAGKKRSTVIAYLESKVNV